MMQALFGKRNLKVVLQKFTCRVGDLFQEDQTLLKKLDFTKENGKASEPLDFSKITFRTKRDSRGFHQFVIHHFRP